MFGIDYIFVFSQRRETETTVKYFRENKQDSRSQKNGKVFAKPHSKLSIFPKVVGGLIIVEKQKHGVSFRDITLPLQYQPWQESWGFVAVSFML